LGILVPVNLGWIGIKYTPLLKELEHVNGDLVKRLDTIISGGLKQIRMVIPIPDANGIMPVLKQVPLNQLGLRKKTVL